jgi:WXG100 family type VII secretion target
VGGYAVEPVELRRCDDLLATAADAARAALGQLRAAATELFAGWHGSAAVAFRLGWEQWVEGVLHMLDALDGLAFALGSSADGYAGTDEAVRTSVARALR